MYGDSFLLDETKYYLSLSMGCLPEEELNSLEPLPKELHHANREAARLSCLETLRRTSNALDKWLKSGLEENRFGLPYIQISKTILDAVTTVGRGLVTLHRLGEDLSQSPKQIGDLLDIASFHFQKCYEGMMNSAGINMTVCTRLFSCQLRWQNLIFRLYRTQDLLNTPYHETKKKAAPVRESSALAPVTAEPAYTALSSETALKPFPMEELTAAEDVLPAIEAEVPEEITQSIPELPAPQDPLFPEEIIPAGEEQNCPAELIGAPVRMAFWYGDDPDVPYVTDTLRSEEVV